MKWTACLCAPQSPATCCIAVVGPGINIHHRQNPHSFVLRLHRVQFAHDFFFIETSLLGSRSLNDDKYANGHNWHWKSKPDLEGPPLPLRRRLNIGARKEIPVGRIKATPSWVGILSIVNRLRAVQPWFSSPQGLTFFLGLSPYQLWRPPGHLHSAYRWIFPWNQNNQTSNMTASFDLMPRLRIRGAIWLLPHTSSWRCA